MEWNLEPGVLAGCAGLAGAYLWAARGAGGLRRLAFAAAEAVLLGALASPLDGLAERTLFSAHMLQHLLLLEVAAPLLVLSVPAELGHRIFLGRWPGLKAWMAWMIGFGMLCLWHVPWLYDAALRWDGVHALEHICFVASACIFWWPVLRGELGASESVLYLFARMAGNLLLGTLIYLAPIWFYGAYLHAATPLPFGLTALADQRLGGILMW
ncbi:MAG: cytochrome c oxidase assembly protein, partial [Terriglobales bacterium]